MDITKQSKNPSKVELVLFFSYRFSVVVRNFGLSMYIILYLVYGEPCMMIWYKYSFSIKKKLNVYSSDDGSIAQLQS